MIGLFIYLLSSIAFGNQVKEMNLKPNDIGAINTAVGFSTVIQVSQKPVNVVIGDQSAFRVEYIGNNITIKPLLNPAKTNLFIFTENDRFNLSLNSGNESIVDYVVRLRRVYEDPKETKILNLAKVSGEVELLLTKLTHGHGETFIDFELRNLSKKRIEILPNGFRMNQSKNATAIKSLYLEKNILNAGEAAGGSILLNKLDPNRAVELLVSFRGEHSRTYHYFLATKKKDHTHEF